MKCALLLAATLAWPRADRPVRIYVGPTAAHHLRILDLGAWAINRAARCQIFARPQLVGVSTVQAWMADGHGMRGTVLVQGDGEFDPPRGHTEPIMSRLRLHAALVTLPREPLPRLRLLLVVLHELRHAAGLLEHSGDPKSISYPDTIDGQRITADDAAELRRACR